MFKCYINIKINQNEMRKYSKSSEFDRLSILLVIVVVGWNGRKKCVVYLQVFLNCEILVIQDKNNSIRENKVGKWENHHKRSRICYANEMEQTSTLQGCFMYICEIVSYHLKLKKNNTKIQLFVCKC